MHIQTVRNVINKHAAELQEEIQGKMESYGMTAVQVAQADPFLSGKSYALGMLVLELDRLEQDQEEARDRARRYIRPES